MIYLNQNNGAKGRNADRMESLKRQTNDERFAELCDLRRSIREKEKKQTGRTPVVCSDEALREMLRLMPKKPNDFYSVAGIGPAFVEKYANAFLTLLNPPAPKGKPDKIGEDVEDILRELSKKLTNLNKSNRMLFLPKLSDKYTVDLFDATGRCNALDLLFYNKKPIVAATPGDSRRPSKEKDRFRSLSALCREVSRSLRDRGQNDLYVAYPFVQGCLSGADFPIRAPLCLFPVTMEIAPETVTIALDPTRDTLCNATLILAYEKFNGINAPLPDCVLDEVNPDVFMQELLDFYAKNGVSVAYESDELKKFAEYTADNFPKYRRGELTLIHNVVVGRFPTYSNVIQKDFDEILENGKINRLISDLVSDYGAADYYADHPENAPKTDASDKGGNIPEGSLTYINPLNSAQETVLHSMDTVDELVVEGPPGTGKSQTITSLITQFIRQDKTVLMVSEKKTALDVVYSRLGNLSRYAMMLDDATNKNQFYGQLERLLLSSENDPLPEAVDMSQVSGEIDADVAVFEEIADKLFRPNDFGVAPYRLYTENKRVDLGDHEKIKTYRTIRTMIPDSLMALPYDELVAIRKKFSNGQLTDALDRYQATVERYPWFLRMKDSLSNYDLVLFADAIDGLLLDIDAWKSKNFLGRLFSKRRLAKKIKQACRGYFRHARSYAVRVTLDQPESLKLSLREFIPGYANLKPIVLSLDDHEKLYLASLRKIHKICGGTVSEWNDSLYNTILFEHIQRFEIENRTLIPKVGSFGKVIDAMERSIAAKQELARKQVERILAEHLKILTSSKRRGDIVRTVDSHRRPSAAKFVSKFEFELFKSIRVWLMTPEAVSEVLPQENGLFDLVIFDEASQLYVEKSIPSIARAKKVVIAGDHKQLRPSSLGEGRYGIDEDLLDDDDEISAALEEESLLDLARFKFPDVLLNTHYRSKYEELIDFSNYAFYKGRLFVAPNITQPDTPPIRVHLVKNATWQGRANRVEAERVVALLKEIFATRKHNETIGVIAFNVAQKDMIYDVIDEASLKDPAFGAEIRMEMARKDNGEDTGFFVKNIESVQGDERDIIIFSIGYAKNAAGRLVHNFGWLNQRGGENRLNVAVSRAKKKIHIVTSFRPADLSVEDSKNPGPIILKRYLEYAFAVSDGNSAEAEAILRSFGGSLTAAPVPIETELARQVADALRAKGLDIDTQVGIGGYRIDVAVKKDGKYVLGIECDGKLYSTVSSARERDYHRQKYLESRGWTIRRLWSMDWWRNPEAEVNAICEAVRQL